MRIAIIGRTEILYETALLLHNQNHEIAIIITSKEAPEYTKTSEDFKSLAKEWSIPFIHTPRIEEAIEIIKKMPQIDIGISLNYSGVVPQSVMELFPMGILNAHGGDLPKYRGNACQAWAIINGENSVGLCIHSMIGGELDSGDILARDYYPLTINTKVTAVYEWMSLKIPVLFSDALKCLKENPAYVLECQSKNPKDALRCYPRKAEDGRIVWSKSAVDILRLINACNKPYVGAFCEFEGQQLIIWDAELVHEQENFCAICGQVCLIGENFVEIACGEGKLRLLQVEVDGLVDSPLRWLKSIRKRLA